MSLLQEESSWVQSISNKITRHEAVIFMMEKTGMKPAPFLRVYSMIKFTVATPWVGSSKAFGMQVAQREGADCILPLVLVPTTQTKNQNQFTLFHFTTEVFHSICSETSHYVSFISFL